MAMQDPGRRAHLGDRAPHPGRVGRAGASRTLRRLPVAITLRSRDLAAQMFDRDDKQAIASEHDEIEFARPAVAGRHHQDVEQDVVRREIRQ